MTSSTQPSAKSPVMTNKQILTVIIGLMSGTFLSALDQNIVSTAIRTIGDDLQGLSQQAWVTTGYLILATVSTPLYGKLSDLFGRRPLFIFAIMTFVLGSVLASFSTSMMQLAWFRALQGLGAGGLMSMPLAITGDILAPRERARYQGYFLAVFGISSFLGPVVGGFFAGTSEILWITGWRWVFLINFPIGLAVLFIILKFLHIPHTPPKRIRIDWWGVTTIILALVPLLLVAEQGREWGWTSPLAMLCYGLGLVSILAFLLIEIRMKDDAIIPLKLFRSSTFSFATLIGFFIGFAMFGAFMTIPLFLQIILGSAPTQSGLQMLPLIFGLMVSSIGSGQLIARTGKYRFLPLSGTIFLSGGYLYLTFLKWDSSYLFLSGAVFIIGLGLGQLMQTLTIASQNSVEPRDIGVATSSSTFFRQIGGTLGTAILLSLIFTLIPTNVQTSLADKATLSSAVDAALTPSIAQAAENKAIMETVYTPLVGPIIEQSQAQARKQAIAQAVAGGTPQAQAEQTIPQEPLDFSDSATRQNVVSHALTSIKSMPSGDQEDMLNNVSFNDTSFLIGANPQLAKPFLQGFSLSMNTVYWIGLAVTLLALVFALFFKAPPLRTKSALQETADKTASFD